MREGFTDSPCSFLYHKELGKGMPLVMLHGNGEDHRIFDRMAAYMSSYYQVILMDSRGHGASELKAGKERMALTTREMAEDVIRVLDDLNVPKAAILGFSDGANIALEAALGYPDRVLAVAAVSGNALPWGVSWRFFWEVQAKYLGLCLSEMLPMSREKKAKIVKERQLNGLMALWPRLGKKELRKIKAPVLLLTGRYDMIRPRHSLWMAGQIPGAEIVFVKRADHFTLLKRERAYGAYIRGWLDKAASPFISSSLPERPPYPLP